MNRKGVEFGLVQIEPDLWKWRFQIGDTVTVGQTRTRLMGMAARRAELRIDQELKRRAAAGPLERSKGSRGCRRVRNRDRDRTR